MRNMGSYNYERNIGQNWEHIEERSLGRKKAIYLSISMPSPEGPIILFAIWQLVSILAI